MPAVPWAVLDGPDALTDPSLPGQLTGHEVRFLVDNQMWRFRDPRYLQSPKWSAQPFTPHLPCDDTRRWVEDAVTRDLLAQASSAPDLYIVPGWFPHRRHDDVRQINGWAMNRAQQIVGHDVELKPLLHFVGLRCDDPEGARRQISELHLGASAAYVHLSHVHASDPLVRVVDAFDLFWAVERRGLPVLAARCAQVGVAFRALGLAAAESGLAEAESFNYARQLQDQVPRPAPVKGSGRPFGGPRVYWPSIGVTLSGLETTRVAAVPGAAALLSCSLPCHRFRPMSEIGKRAVEHSLRSRVEEAHEIVRLPSSMRVDRAFNMITDRRNRLRQVNAELRAAGERLLDETQLSTQLALLTDRSYRRGAA